MVIPNVETVVRENIKMSRYHVTNGMELKNWCASCAMIYVLCFWWSITLCLFVYEAEYWLCSIGIAVVVLFGDTEGFGVLRGMRLVWYQCGDSETTK